MKTYLVSYNYTEEMLANIFCAALEGGCNYWLYAYDPESERGFLEDSKISDLDIKEYLSLKINEPNGDQDCNEPVLKTEITHKDLADAISKLFNDPVGCGFPQHQESYIFDYSNHDANTADVVLQVAVFGKVIYA